MTAAIVVVGALAVAAATCSFACRNCAPLISDLLAVAAISFALTIAIAPAVAG